MLYLIGLGLDNRDLTIKALEAIKKCKLIYLEIYTSKLSYPVKELEKFIKKKIRTANRESIEQNADSILKEAKKENVAILIPGDVFAATTHLDLLMRAKKEKIKVKIIHGISIFNAITETGLQLYKFGKTASIPKWQNSYKPESFYNTIKKNLSINAHTLLLLDIGLEVKEALSYLREICEKRLEGFPKQIIICSCLGTAKSRIIVGKLNNLINKKINLPACIIIPSDLHFLEAEALGIKEKNKSRGK